MNKYRKIFQHTKPTAVKPPWVMRLPQGVRERPSWIFIGTVISLSGLSYVLGVSDSAVVQSIGGLGLQIWGAFLCVSGLSVIIATFKNDVAFEKLAMRLTILSILAYISFLMTSVPIARIAMPVALGLVLVAACEVRVSFLNAQLNRPIDTEAHNGP